MRRTLVLAALAWMTVSGYSQTVGVVQCNGRTSVSAWEMPDSIVVVEQLSCGQQVVVMGEEKGYLRIRIKRNVYGYLRPKHVGNLPGAGLPDWASEAKDLYKNAMKSAPSVSDSFPDAWPEDLSAEKPQEPKSAASALQSGLEIGFDSSYIRYEEPEYMKEEGFTLSLYGDYTFRPRSLMFRLAGRMGFAGMDYDSPVSGEADRIRDYLVEARALAGRTFRASDAWDLTPFAGIGYRYLHDAFGGITTSEGHTGYDRRSNYLYSPIGLESGHRLTDSWGLVVSGEYDHFWHGWQYSDLGSLFGSSYTAVNDQKHGWGLRWSGKFEKKIPKYRIVFGPYLKYWNIEDSETVHDSVDGNDIWIVEPANTSFEIGATFGIAI